MTIVDAAVKTIITDTKNRPNDPIIANALKIAVVDVMPSMVSEHACPKLLVLDINHTMPFVTNKIIVAISYPIATALSFKKHLRICSEDSLGTLSFACAEYDRKTWNRADTTKKLVITIAPVVIIFLKMV